MEETTLEADIVVIGGGSAGSTAAFRAQQSLPRGRVILLEKANIKRSGAMRRAREPGRAEISGPRAGSGRMHG